MTTKTSLSTRLTAVFLTVLMLFSCIPMTVFAAEDNDAAKFNIDSYATITSQNVHGDEATKGNWENVHADFNWTSIPNHNSANAMTFSLIDGAGEPHMAFCIDSSLPSGVFDGAPNATYLGTYRGIGAQALYAIAQGIGDTEVRDVKVLGMHFKSTDPQTGQVYQTVIPSKTFNLNISRNNIILALRWLAWTNNIDDLGNPSSNRYNGIEPNLNGTDYEQKAWKDFLNLANYSGVEWPDLYAHSVYYQFEYRDAETNNIVPPNNVNGLEDKRYESAWISDNPSKDNFSSTVSLDDEYGIMPLANFFIVIGDDGRTYYCESHLINNVRKITYQNYETILADEEFSKARSTYVNMLDDVVNKLYNSVLNIARDQGDVVGHVWSNGVNYQRFVTFDYIPQVIELQLIKKSAIPAVSDGNNMYSLDGIKYEVIANGQSVGESLVLNANGVSNVIELKASDNIHIGDTIYLREVDDPVRKASGYALDTNLHPITLQAGRNTLEVSDVPLNDPPSLQLQKVDKETGESYDKIGI